jgi:hypothetical protein
MPQIDSGDYVLEIGALEDVLGVFDVSVPRPEGVTTQGIYSVCNTKKCIERFPFCLWPYELKNMTPLPYQCHV